MSAGRPQHVLLTAFLLAGASFTLPTRAEPFRTPAAPPEPASVPQRTTATFADWTLRCEHPAGVAEVCEIAQAVSVQGQTVAQIALGRVAHGEPMHLSLLLPASVTFGQPPRLGGPGKDAPLIELGWRRCLPGGCFAEAHVSDEQLRQLRARTEATKVVFLDGAGKEAALPFSPHGLGQALDALAREEGSQS